MADTRTVKDTTTVSAHYELQLAWSVGADHHTMLPFQLPLLNLDLWW